MTYDVNDISYVEMLFQQFYHTGSTVNGGVTRLGYSAEEDEMHEIFRRLNEQEGNFCTADEAGNSFAALQKDDKPYVLIGSHLDSVIDGGRYDGVSGILAGMMVLHWARRDGLQLPLRVGAFRCEESSNFGRSTIGSSLIPGRAPDDTAELAGVDGRTIREVFKAKGYSLHPAPIDGISRYLELHIEQGKVLQNEGFRVGIVQTIAGPRRFNLHLIGLAEHSGATPMNLRTDALCAAAELILAVEKIGNRGAADKSVATVGVIHNQPNALNVIPGRVRLGVDLRGIRPESLDRMEKEMIQSAEEICARRGVTFFRERLGGKAPTDMDSQMQEDLLRAARRLKISAMPIVSGAGHDAMNFAGICPTGMVFIPCDRGISHNKQEFTPVESICDGAAVLYEYLKGAAK